MSESVQPLYVAVQKEHTAVCSALEQIGVDIQIGTMVLSVSTFLLLTAAGR